MALPIGEILDRKFKIVQVIGEGGMGTVYKVELLDRPGNYCAVKELLINPTTSAEERKTAIERFNKEIDLLSPQASTYSFVYAQLSRARQLLLCDGVRAREKPGQNA